MELSNPEDREILLDFVQEGLEGLEKAEAVLLFLEPLATNNQPVSSELIDDLFRVFHSIKGSAGFLGLKIISELTHSLESLLDKLRKGEIRLTKTMTDLFFEACDELHALFKYLNRTLSEDGYQGNNQTVLTRINDMLKSEEAQAAQPTQPAEKPDQESPITDELIEQFIVEATELLENLEQELLKLEKDANNEHSLQKAFRALHNLKSNAGFLNFKDMAEVAHQAETVLDLARNKELTLSTRQISLILKIIDFLRAAVNNLLDGKPPVIPGKLALIDLLREMVPRKEVGQTTAEKEQPAGKSTLDELEEKLSRQSSAKATTEMVRVNVQKLDKLIDLVGEIVIAETMLSMHPLIKTSENESLDKALTYLRKNIRELQDLSASMRMVPLKGLFSKMRRLVRDISVKRDKEAELEIVGAENEVDRSIIENLSDPLIHILRNAIDHGIETPEERKAKGKPITGHIVLSAQQVGGEIWIEVKDDGRGLDKKKILKKASERHLLPEGHTQLSDYEIYNLIFKPGFSTADRVTNISGRGVGMDVVKQNVEKIRGHISLESKEGQGTTIKLKIPLTTAIIDGMLMRVKDTFYAIPMLDIRESLHVQKDQVIDLVDGQEVIRVRDELIPVIRLDRLHNLSTEWMPIDEGIVVVTQMEKQAIGFWVHEVVGEQQLVLKPVPKYLGKLQGISGCAILGEGDICLVLDLKTITQMIRKGSI